MKSCEEMYEGISPLFENGDHGGAIEAIQKLLHAYPGFAQGHYDLGALNYKNGDKETALTHYREAVNLDPQNETFLKSVADFYYTEIGDITEATKLYCRVTEMNPDDVGSLMILGNLAVVAKDFDTAKDYYKQVLDVEPWNHDALIFYEKLDQRKPQDDNLKDAELAYSQSQHFVESGKLSEAIEKLESLIDRWPDFAPAYNDLGVLYYQSGMKEKTLEHYETAVRLEPQQLNYQKNLADFYCIEMGRIENALEIYLRVLQQEPTDIETLTAAGYICQALKRNADATVFFERVQDIEPWNIDANENLNPMSPIQFDAS